MNRKAIIQKRKDKGFTLIELLIVIAILGILSTIVVLSVRGITDRGQQSACDTDKKTLETAYEAAYAVGVSFATVSSDVTNLLVPNYLHSASTNYSINNLGVASAKPAPGGKC